ncbi:MAG: peptide transporter [Lentisphaerae bacterium RIFOXYA12_FULL_60_10]|nr:MAG: peptide transporter [Lentisphaerae bacterium RIFOXYA12_FULL_60_10]
MAKTYQLDKELEQYRRLMEPPEEFRDGFSWKTVIGAIFLGMIMMPAGMYLQLFEGSSGNMMQASRWVTIIIFSEIARRSLKELKMQEVYILFYMAGLALAEPFGGLLWNQFFVQSDYARAMGVAQEIPSWFAPSAEEIKRGGRSFFTMPWMIPVLFVSFSVLISKLDNFGLGYVLYRITNDVEKLPFPMAPVGASGIVSLTESKENRQPWRWRCFSIGGMMGMVFGAFYIGVPAITGVFLAKPIQLIPIPWVDLTPALSKFLPATPLNLAFNFGAFLVGTVMPFWAVMGGLFGVVFTMMVNPTLYRNGILSNWTEQMGFIDTAYSNQIDFYLSFGVGLTVAVSLISLWRVFRPLFVALGNLTGTRAKDTVSQVSDEPSAWQRLVTNNVKRGDFSIFISLGIYVFTTATWLSLSTYLVEGFPWKFFVGYAIIYTPIISYASAKLEGLCGQAVAIPMVREAAYILSGFRGVKIWFAPVPMPNYGPQAQEFRVLELTGTKICGQVKTQLVTYPIVLISSLVFSHILWQMAEVPSEAYPFANKMWDFQAKMSCLTFSSTMEGGSLFMEAWKWDVFGWGLGLGVLAFTVLSSLGLPTLLVFGMVRGLGENYPGAMIFQALGAFVGHFYLKKRFGSMWLKYAPVLLAGFTCGMGLVGMLSIAFSILTRMMSPLVF